MFVDFCVHLTKCTEHIIYDYSVSKALLQQTLCSVITLEAKNLE
jgi:hypothetical protein